MWLISFINGLTNLESNPRIHGDFIHLTLWVVTFWMARGIFLCEKNYSLNRGENMWCLNKERDRVVLFRASAQYVKCCLVWRNMINAVLFGATSRYVVLGCVHVGMYHTIVGAQTRPHFIVHIHKPISVPCPISTSSGRLFFKWKEVVVLFGNGARLILVRWCV